MRQLGRYFRVALVLLSAMLCILVVVLYFRSETIDDRVSYEYARRDASGAAVIDYILAWSTHQYVWFNVSFDRLERKRSGYYQYDEIKRTGGRRTIDFTHFANLNENFLVDPFEGMKSRGPIRIGNWRDDRPKDKYTDHTIRTAAPHWVVATLLAVAPAWWLVHWLVTWLRRRRRAKRGLCRACGYDIRASSERCPECGYAIPAGATSLLPQPSDLQSPVS